MTPSRRVGKPLVFLAALAPALWLAWTLLVEWRGADWPGAGWLGADPVEKLQGETGRWTLIFLALTLAVTPLRRLFGWNGLQPYRRMLGLFAFLYATLHLLNYVALWMTFDLGDIAEDVAEHPWVWIGVIAWTLLVPLAITSTKGWVRRLGGKRWQRLHRVVYVVAIAGLVHFFLAVKRDVQEPTIYALVFATLLGARLVLRRRAAGRARLRERGDGIAPHRAGTIRDRMHPMASDASDPSS